MFLFLFSVLFFPMKIGNRISSLVSLGSLGCDMSQQLLLSLPLESAALTSVNSGLLLHPTCLDQALGEGCLELSNTSWTR